MEAHVTFHADQVSATNMAVVLRKRGFQVALAGPVDQTFLRNGDDDNDPLVGQRWIVLATNSGLIMVD